MRVSKAGSNVSDAVTRDPKTRLYDTRAGGDRKVQNIPPIAYVYVLAKAVCSVLLCSLAVLDLRVGLTLDVLSLFISILCHSD